MNEFHTAIGQSVSVIGSLTIIAITLLLISWVVRYVYHRLKPDPIVLLPEQSPIKEVWETEFIGKDKILTYVLIVAVNTQYCVVIRSGRESDSRFFSLTQLEEDFARKLQRPEVDEIVGQIIKQDHDTTN